MRRSCLKVVPLVILGVALHLAVRAGFGLSSMASQSNDQQSQGKDRQLFANASLEAAELADFLGISAWTFHYEGGAPRCWVEVIEQGQKTVSQPTILDVKTSSPSKEAAQGKILLFLRPGNIELRLSSGVSSGGAGVGLPPTALWWGWKASSGSAERLERPLSPRPAQEVPLLNYVMEEEKTTAKDPKNPRKVQMVLKARMES